MTLIGAGQQVSDQNLLAEIEGIIRSAPDRIAMRKETPEAWGWLGRAISALHLWNSIEAAFAKTAVDSIHNPMAAIAHTGYMKLMTVLYQAQNDLRMRTLGPVDIAIGQGMVFDYFDELRKIIELAAADVLFVDPYMNADFVSQYLPHVKSGVTIRLLGKQYMPALIAAAEAFAKQYGQKITVRSSPALHDRFLFIDGQSCYLSGASFKDGPKNAGTVVSQIVDAFPVMHANYEALWSGAKVEL